MGTFAHDTHSMITTTVESTLDRAKPITETAAHAVSPSKITDYAQKKVATATTNFMAHLPLYERAGFSLRTLDLELGITPHLTPRFALGTVPPKEERDALLVEARAAGGSAHAVLTALFKAVELKDLLSLGSLELVGLNVRLSTIPSVRLVFE